LEFRRVLFRSAMVEAGQFREDLLFRIKVIEIALPPLHQRGQDILEIAEQLLRRFADENSTSARTFTPAARVALSAYRWPGNVRELKNVIERAAILCDGDAVDLDVLPPEFSGPFAGDHEGPALDLKL